MLSGFCLGTMDGDKSLSPMDGAQLNKRRSLVFLRGTAGVLLPIVAIMSEALAEARPVFIKAQQVESLLSRDACVLDARGPSATGPFITGAITVNWKDVRAGLLRDGRLTTFDKARAYYEKQGVRASHPVVVYGAGYDGWGEEGRIWWDLVILGHPEVYILDGGIKAWLSYRGSTSNSAPHASKGRFPAKEERLNLRLDHRDVLRLSNTRGVILDVRTLGEYQGQTPYYSPRGGHIPGAVHLHWKDLLELSGELRPEVELRDLITSAGVRSDRRVATYCTGGVRSAFVVAVLTHLGFLAANYDGSWWDWSSRDELFVETSEKREQ